MSVSETPPIAFDFPDTGERIWFAAGTPIFRLFGRGNDDRPLAVSSADLPAPNVAHADQTTILSYTGFVDGGAELEITVRLTQTNREVLGTIDLRIRGPLRVERVQFPILDYRPVHVFDHLLISSPWGDNIPRPVKTIREACHGRHVNWDQVYVEFGDAEVSYTYPSILAMQYLVLHNQARSVYLACYGDGEATLKLSAAVLPGGPGQGLRLAVNHFPFLMEGDWRSPPCSLAILRGDWHAAADLYASHMRPRFSPPDVPAWLRTTFHGWAGVGMQFEGQPPRYRYRDLPALAERVRAAGLNVLHIYAWSGSGHDTAYPDYDTNPELGTPEELRAAMDAIRAMDVYPILYTNGRLVDPRSRFYEAGGDAALARDREGQPYVEQYGTSAAFRLACPSSEAYRSYLVAQVRRMLADYGAWGLQIDQISCNLAVFCYDTTHEHPTPATSFLPGVERMLREIRLAHQAHNPDIFVWCEGCHERFGRLYDINQGHGEETTWQLGESLPEQFSYTYPDRIVTGLCWDVQPLCYAYAQGKPFDLGLERLDDPVFAGLLRDFVDLRRAHPEYFLRGTFRDSAGLVADGRVRAFGIERADGRGLLVNLWLPGAGPTHASTAWLKHPRPGWNTSVLYPAAASLSVAWPTIELAWQGPVITLRFEEQATCSLPE